MERINKDVLGEGYTDMRLREMFCKASVLNLQISKCTHTMDARGFHLLNFNEKKREEESKRRREEKFTFLRICLVLCTLHVTLNVLPLLILSY